MPTRSSCACSIRPGVTKCSASRSDPERGQRFNPHKLLIEPYAKHLQGPLAWSDAHFGYRTGHAKADLSFDRRDSAAGTPKCRVVDPAFTWGDDRPPRVPWHDTVI